LETIRLFVENITYYNEENYYSVLEVSEGDDLFTAVGYLPYISAGETVDATGEYTVHPLYGKQFSIQSFEIVRPESADMIERYLACGAVKGIGPALAKRIVKKFKADTFRIMEEEPERLAEVKGISENTAMLIAEQIEQKRGFRDAVMYMQGFGIGSNLAGRIYETYGPAVYSILEKNPYRLADDVDGVGFRLADAIAQRTGIPSDSEFRIKSGIVYVLQDGVAQGHTWVPEDELLHFASELLSVSEEQVSAQLMDLQMDGKIVMLSADRDALSADRDVPSWTKTANRDVPSWTKTANGDAPSAGSERPSCPNRQIYLASCYHVEKNIAIRLNALNIKGQSDENFVEKRIREVYKETGMEPDTQQEEAIRATVKNGVLILTGGPGTGKTTTINNIIRYYKKDNYGIMLAAPTGRAAKRMTEATGCEAKTIHRLLEYTGAPTDEDNRTRVSSYGDVTRINGPGTRAGGRFLRDEKDPLDCDVLIVDEMSMVDIFLMDALLRAVVPGTRVILVGDANQLPSVGAGNVLRDMIASKEYNTVCLNHIFRQAAQSDIVLNAHAINSGEPVDLSKKSKDFLFIRSAEPDAIMNVIKKLITEKLPGYVDADTYSIQVLTPTRKGALGIEVLNPELQAFLNPPARNKQEKKVGAVTFREGDKVMQIKNDYDMEWSKKDARGLTKEHGTGIYNGDVGRILKIDPHAELVTVLFDDDRIAEYGNKEMKELELAYAVTVHKAQGSEYPAVVIPMYYGPSMLMNRNLLYTAVTRARKCVCMVGLPNVFERMAANRTESRRYSGLTDRIEEISVNRDVPS